MPHEVCKRYGPGNFTSQVTRLEGRTCGSNWRDWCNPVDGSKFQKAAVEVDSLCQEICEGFQKPSFSVMAGFSNHQQSWFSLESPEVKGLVIGMYLKPAQGITKWKDFGMFFP